MKHKSYLFDTDALITSKNFHYSPNFCLAFWDWIIAGNSNSVFYTIDKVADECKIRRDYLYDFVDTHNSCFVKSTNSTEIYQKYSDIQSWAVNTWAQGKNTNKTIKALEKFALEKTADPWLIAYASIHECHIITNEVPRMDSQTSVKLPDVANAFGVKVFKLHEVLNNYSENNFSFKAF